MRDQGAGLDAGQGPGPGLAAGRAARNRSRHSAGSAGRGLAEIALRCPAKPRRCIMVLARILGRSMRGGMGTVPGACREL